MKENLKEKILNINERFVKVANVAMYIIINSVIGKIASWKSGGSDKRKSVSYATGFLL